MRPTLRLFRTVCAHCKRVIAHPHPSVVNPGVVHGVCTACAMATELRLAEVRKEAAKLLI